MPNRDHGIGPAACGEDACSREMATQDEKVSLHVIEFGDLGKTSPLCEPEPLEKRDAWSVGREEEPEQGIDEL